MSSFNSTVHLLCTAASSNLTDIDYMSRLPLSSTGSDRLDTRCYDRRSLFQLRSLYYVRTTGYWSFIDCASRLGILRWRGRRAHSSVPVTCIYLLNNRSRHIDHFQRSTIITTVGHETTNTVQSKRNLQPHFAC